MKFSLRDAVPVLMLASLAVFATGCKPGDKPDAAKTADKAATDGKTEGAVIPGLETEKQKVSYMIGLDIAKSLTPVKDEVDFDTMTKALKTALAGETPLMDEKQATAVREAFGQKLQAKQIAEMLAKAKANLTQGETFLAANAKKPGV
ncbi:MAG: FKBP-type peptidyl-prolyl cis-trans isomerase N-terminal domain-containing protein, partial [Gammaproteobacteria bacterium]|nr:FKBP-type peptidyl-prolyl cis-trans isomerase N-terminal domain-containing protein [Gammaproteobacteria bacterium]